MPNRSRAAVSNRLLPILSLPILVATGCGVSGVVNDPEAEAVVTQCASPVEGSRYSLCGKLTTAGFGGPGAEWTLRGSVDTAAQPQGSGYSIRGGSFHVAR